ncbi:MAG: helix-turn-helix domain-containing protein [Nitrosopumilus sp.]
MGETVATLEDLERMKNEIIQALKEVSRSNSTSEKKWIRSKEVREILSISSSTLQTMRIRGKIPFSKISGIIYYPVEGIQKLLNKNLRNSE